jgi:hypothetical protein
VGALYYQWFAVANRYDIFLYYHLGSLPFDTRTTSRYLMAGLVAGGVVLVLNTGGWLIAGQAASLWGRTVTPPSLVLVWALSALPLGAVVVAITTTQNDPALPLPLAVGCATVALLGLGLALLPCRLAAKAPARLLWLAAGGLCVAPCLLLLRAVELPGRGLVPFEVAYPLAFGATAAGAGALLLLSAAARRWSPGALWGWGVFLAAFCICYLVLPLLHHLFFTPPGHRYITVSDNFFALHWAVQVLCFAAALGVAHLPGWLSAGDQLAVNISQGEHVITYRATDVDGNVAPAQPRITVGVRLFLSAIWRRSSGGGRE